MQKPLIFVTNDDGISAPGILFLVSVAHQLRYLPSGQSIESNEILSAWWQLGVFGIDFRLLEDLEDEDERDEDATKKVE